MVAVKTYEADRFLSRPVPGIIAYLVHGNDAGLVSERARLIARTNVTDPNDPFQIVRMEGDEVASDPLMLIDEANSVGLFGGKRAIWVRLGSRSIQESIESLLEFPPQDCVIVLEAGSLRRESPVRKLCEGRKNAVSIECYPDSNRDLELLIENEMKEGGLTIDRDAKDLLSHLLGLDRLTTRSEVAKLRLYVQGRQSVTVEDVKAVIADASGLESDDAIAAAFSGKLSEVEAILGRILTSSVHGSVLIGAGLRNAITLHRSCLEIEGGLSVDTAIEKLKRSPAGRALANQIRYWSSSRSSKAIELLAAAIEKTRRHPDLDREIAARALWSVARIARPS